MNRYIIIVTLMLSACATTQWTPKVSNADSKYQEAYQYCDKLLGGYKAGENALIGAGAGALVGLAIAGFFDTDPAMMAGIGAAGAGASTYANSDIKYKENMIKCLKQQNYDVYEWD